ncbi:MAG: hypothetical protein ACTSXU_05695, partial [Promethearchaeota archaeon]
YPFTNYNTIEIRVFDTQLSLLRRINIVLLIEALCLKAARLLENNVEIPCVNSAILIANREKAIKFGLHGKFIPDTLLSRSFGIIYNEDPMTGKVNGKLYQAVKGMFFFLKKELEDLGFSSISSLFQAQVLGFEKLDPPITSADYLLYLYQQANNDIESVMTFLKSCQDRYCAVDIGNLSDPILEEWGGKVPDLLHASKGQSTRTKVTALSQGEIIDISDLKLDTTISESEHIPAIKYTLSFIINSTSSNAKVKALLIQQLIETRKKKEHLITSSIKMLEFNTNKIVVLNESDFPLNLDPGLFLGNKQCRLKFSIKVDKKERSIYSGAFWLELFPKLLISSTFKKRSIISKEDLVLKFQVTPKVKTRQVPKYSLLAIFQISSPSSGKVIFSVNKKFEARNKMILEFKVRPEDFLNYSEIKYKLLLTLENKIIGRFESKAIKVINPALERAQPYGKNFLKDAGTRSDLGHGKTPFSFANSAKNDAKPVTMVTKTLKFSSTITNQNKLEKQQVASKKKDAGKKKIQETRKSKVILPNKIKDGMKNAKPVSGRSLLSIEKTFKEKKAIAGANIDAHAGRSKIKEEIADIFSGKGKDKGEGESLEEIPFTEKSNYIGYKLEIEYHLKSSNLIAPGNKVSVQYRLIKKKNINETINAKIVAFLVNANQDVTIISKDKQKISNMDAHYSLVFDPGKIFKFWKPTLKFHLILQVYQENAIIGQSVISNFKIASFTTSSQIVIKKLAPLGSVFYTSMDSGVQMDLLLKSIIIPIKLFIIISCQNFNITKEIRINKAGLHQLILPFQMPYKGLMPLRQSVMSIKVLDNSKMELKEERTIISVVPRGPLFVVKNVQVEPLDYKNNIFLGLDLYNDGKFDVNGSLTILIKNHSKKEFEKLDSKNFKLLVNNFVHLEFKNLYIPPSTLLEEKVEFMFLIKTDSFKESTSLIPVKIKRREVIGKDMDYIIYGVIKNLDNYKEIDSRINKMSLEIELHWKLPLNNVKVRLLEFLDGSQFKIIKTLKIPRDKNELYMPIYWNPPKAKFFPRFCKLEMRFYEGEQKLEGEGFISKPLLFRIYPE